MSGEKRIFVEGFSSGIFAGFAFKTGVSVDEGSLMIMVMKTFCEATEGIYMQSSFNCAGFVTIISLLALLTSAVAIFEVVTNADDWRIGAGIYGAGFIAGVLLIFAYI